MTSARFNPFPDSPEHELILLPERAIFWPAARSLLITDLHLGKTQTFWSAGAPIPAGILEADLARLDTLLRRTEAQRLIILGDLLHSGIGLTQALIDTVAAWREKWGGIECVIIPGNHDRDLNRIAASWRLTIAPPIFHEPPFALRHDPIPTPGAYTLCGHIHPLARVSSTGDSLRLPCFWMGRQVGVLPAFSIFTRGVTIQPEAHDHVFILADARVVAL